MTTKEILGLDYYDGNQQTIQNALHKIKPFREIPGEVPLESIERYVGLVVRKYAIQVDYVCPTYVPEERNIYSVTIRRTYTNRYYDVLYGSTLYELYVKIAILFWALTNPKKDFPRQDWKKVKADREARLKRIEAEEIYNG